MKEVVKVLIEVTKLSKNSNFVTFIPQSSTFLSSKNDLKKKERDMKMHDEMNMDGEENKRSDAVIVIQK